jgi:hypothetical protein
MQKIYWLNVYRQYTYKKQMSSIDDIVEYDVIILAVVIIEKFMQFIPTECSENQGKSELKNKTQFIRQFSIT